MSTSQLLAHPGQSLVKHLLGVAERARGFAVRFGGEDHAWLAGLLHDLGKAEKSFQDRIGGKKAEKRPHAHHGASLALEHQLWPVAFAVNGHHAGLHNRSDLQQMVAKWAASSRECEGCLKEDAGWPAQTWPIVNFGKTLPEWLETVSFAAAGERDAKMRAVDFYARMLFSALVDADRLDTEESNVAEGSQANVLKRKGWRFGPKGLAAVGAAAALLKLLDEAIKERVAAAILKNASAAVLETRANVLIRCEEQAASDRGIFTLAVPTGGGKTLASVAFALHHILYHNKKLADNDLRRLRRIIVVIPYLNIIQQTTRELRNVFKCVEIDPVILEHHSQAADPEIKGNSTSKTDKDSDGYDKERPLRQLAAENWDAPIVVTTSVQFFDSLFSRRPADARKLHNICQSVVIFDEVQTLPPLLLQPILDALKELTAPPIDENDLERRNEQRPYGCSAVFCTATQPALGHNENDFPFGLKNVRPIIPPDTAKKYFNDLKRVEYRGLSKDTAPPILGNEALGDAMLAAPRRQALAILNTRKQARRLFDVLREKTKSDSSLGNAVLHLSTWMHPAHRLQVLGEVTRRLMEEAPCLLISTQCVEAGVDVDFPAVWRAFGPYDSIVQAAGRCNRNGALKDQANQPAFGQIHVFTPEDSEAPQGTYASATQTADLLRRMDKATPDDPASFETYFRLLYQATVPDIGGCAVQSAREKLHFKEVSDLFRFIDADTVPVLVPHRAWTELPAPEGAKASETFLEWLQNPKRSRIFKGKPIPAGFLTPDEWRQLQPYMVNLSFPAGKLTQAFLKASDSQLVFEDDDPIRGLRLLKPNSPLYRAGPNEPGLDVHCEGLRDLANYVL